jgi:hypothetical protein
LTFPSCQEGKGSEWLVEIMLCSEFGEEHENTSIRAILIISNIRREYVLKSIVSFSACIMNYLKIISTNPIAARNVEMIRQKC